MLKDPNEIGTRCTGKCCESFPLTCGETLDEIDFFLRAVADDGQFVADMLIPIRPLFAGAQYPNGDIVPEERAPNGRTIGWVFTCKHFDTEARICTVYSERPIMCRDYPYGSACDHGSNCAWDKGRAGKHPPRFIQYEDKRLDTGRMSRRVHLKVLNNDEPPLLMKGPEQ